jgi:hypothetical protein
MTPPKNRSKDDVDRNIRMYTKMQEAMWGFVLKQVASLGRQIDVLVAMGDLIDGPGEKSGGTEQITTRNKKQCEMATEVMKLFGAKTNYIIRGTPYHTGNKDDNEDQIGSKDCKIKDIFDQQDFDFNGLIVDCKHDLPGGGGLPNSRFAAIAKEKLWAEIGFARQLRDDVDVVVRAHKHFYAKVEDSASMGVIVPCFQAPIGDSKYGRRCSGILDLGFIIMDITSKENYICQPHIMKTNLLKRVPLVVGEQS